MYLYANYEPAPTTTNTPPQNDPSRSHQTDHIPRSLAFSFCRFALTPCKCILYIYIYIHVHPHELFVPRVLSIKPPPAATAEDPTRVVRLFFILFFVNNDGKLPLYIYICTNVYPIARKLLFLLVKTRPRKLRRGVF